MTIRFKRIQILAIVSIALLFTVWTYSTAWAEEIVHTAEVVHRLTDWDETISVDQFDPALGRLTQVEVYVKGTLNGDAQFESFDSEAAEIVIGMSTNIDLHGPTDVFIAQAAPAASQTILATLFDGDMDFGGTSGETFVDIVAVDLSNSALYTTEEETIHFLGNGQVSLTLQARGRSTATGAGNLATSFTLATSAEVTVIYTYTPPSVDIEKHTNGEDADIPTGPQIPVGNPVTWEYFVTNTGSMTLTNVTVEDDQGLIVACPKTILRPGETMTCQASGVATLGQYTNIGTVSGQPVDDEGNEQGDVVTDEDTSNYIGVEPPVSCPVDALPTIEYLGGVEKESDPSQTFTMPDGFEVFVVKRPRPLPFHFVTLTGDVDEHGRRIYTTTPGERERVWACAGDCDFDLALLRDSYKVGHYGPGTIINMVMIDDDQDDRLDWWAANDPESQDVIIESNGMTVYLSFEVPFEATWYFTTRDSIGLVDICIDQTAVTTNASANELTNKLEQQVTERKKFNSIVFLPLISAQ